MNLAMGSIFEYKYQAMAVLQNEPAYQKRHSRSKLYRVFLSMITIHCNFEGDGRTRPFRIAAFRNVIIKNITYFN